MNRRIGWLSLAFVVLLGVGVYLFLFGRPAVPNENPLKNVHLDKTSVLLMKTASQVVRLEKIDTTWKLTAPILDYAEASTVETMIAALKEFTLSSVVSENPTRYSEFHVDSSQATELEVYIAGGEKPVFSGFIGKDSGQYQNSYFRYNVSSGPVYIANGLPQYQFRREPNMYRLMNVFALPNDQPSRLQFVNGKDRWDLARSSETWISSSGKNLDVNAMAELVAQIRDLKIDQFGTNVELPADLGFEPPGTPEVLTVTVNNTSAVLTIGKSPKSITPSVRYVRVTDRPTLILNEAHVNQLREAFSKLPK